MNACILCLSDKLESYFEDQRRIYLKCGHCSLVQVPSEYWLKPDAEKAEYDLHENSLDDPGYRQFLSRCSEPLLKRLEAGQQGLDFGCGPVPVLATMLEEQGHPTAIYDIYYAPDAKVLNRVYDFITATEVIEHLGKPKQVFELWLNSLRPCGWLAIMTKRVQSHKAFTQWHYKNDATHIAFYALETFEYLASTYSIRLEIVGQDVVLLQKEI